MFSSDLLFFNNALKMSEAIYYHLGRGGYSERTLGQFSGSHGEKNPEKGIGAGETPRGKSESWKWKLISMERSLPQQMRHSLRSQSGERRKRPQRRLLYLFFFFLSFPSSQFLKISRPVWGRPFPRFKSQRVKLCGIWASLFLSSPDVFSISVFFSALFLLIFLWVFLILSFLFFVFFGPCLEERKNSQLKKKTHKSRCTFTLVVKSRFYEYANLVTPPMMYKPHPLQLLIFEWAAFAYLDYERCWLGRFLETEVNLLSPPGSWLVSYNTVTWHVLFLIYQFLWFNSLTPLTPSRGGV